MVLKSSLLARASLAFVVALSLPSAASAQENIDRIFGGIHVEENKEYGSLETVNGGITIGGDARVRNAETVNGGIVIGDKANVGSAETVNGGIRIESGALVGRVETVNGGIKLDKNAHVENNATTVNGGISGAPLSSIGGDVETVNGSVRMTDADVGGDITLVNGDIILEAGSVISGGLHVEKPTHNWFNFSKNDPPRIVLGENVVVKGPLVFERDVELYVHPSAKHGAITGAVAKPYSAYVAGND